MLDREVTHPLGPLGLRDTAEPAEPAERNRGVPESRRWSFWSRSGPALATALLLSTSWSVSVSSAFAVWINKDTKMRANHSRFAGFTFGSSTSPGYV